MLTELTGLLSIIPSLPSCVGLGSMKASSGEAGVVERCKTGALGTAASGVELGVDIPIEAELEVLVGLGSMKESHGLKGVGMRRSTGGAGGCVAPWSSWLPSLRPMLTRSCRTAGLDGGRTTC
mmetsp:Transcript_13425/g.27951  ORF Transcript_13425/g.27951 Transcript_13425/m.27951 type:complete len:123 (-) Transcript_13425:92-460(-)